MFPFGAKGTFVDFIDFTPRGTQPDLDYPLAGSASCGGCHGGAPNEKHYPRNSWSGSMMANATRDPLFWAALDVANADGAANGAEGIGDFCLRCHTPKGWYAGRVRKLRDVDAQEGMVNAGDVVDGTNGCLLQGTPDGNDGSDSDFGGIGCHTCHRLLPTGPQGQPALLENGDAWIDDVACDGGAEPCRGGPYTYPSQFPNGDPFDGPPHPAEFSAHQGSSEACGTCHDVTSPILDSGPFRTLIVDDGSNAGDDTGLPFPAERTYSEWKASDFATVLFRDGLEEGGAGVAGVKLARGDTCQGCHMPQATPIFPDDELQVCGSGPPRNDNLPVHEFAGGNTWIPNILKHEMPMLEAAESAFDRTVAWATTMLTQRSALVETSAMLAGDTVNASVKITNLAGHKLPSGYSEGRRMWLDVQLLDANQQVLWHNGAWDPATGELEIDGETKIYEIKQGIWDAATGECDTTDAQGRERFHFVLNDCIAKDNRIPPLGFTGAQDPEIASYGHAYPTVAGCTANFDVTNYAIPLPGGAALPVTVRATLRYQLATKEYIAFLRDQAVERGFPSENAMCGRDQNTQFEVGPRDKTRGQYVMDLWNDPDYGRSPPVDMAVASDTVGS